MWKSIRGLLIIEVKTSGTNLSQLSNGTLDEKYISKAVLLLESFAKEYDMIIALLSRDFIVPEITVSLACSNISVPLACSNSSVPWLSVCALCHSIQT